MKKKIFLVTTTAWNGTVPIDNLYYAFSTKESAEKIKTLIIEKNKCASFNATTKVDEVTYFEYEEDIQILNQKEQSD